MIYQKTTQKRYTYIIIFIATLAIITECNRQSKNLTSYDFGGNFSLTDHNNKTFELKQTKGKIVLLFFGYTYCPDACPTTLYKLKETFKLMDKEEIQKIQILFVSVDPERDTIPKLKQYLESFKINILGLTGTIKEINKVVKQYKAIYKKNFYKSKAEYLIDHSTYLYLIDKKGQIRYLFKHAQKPNFLSETIKEAMYIEN